MPRKNGKSNANSDGTDASGVSTPSVASRRSSRIADIAAKNLTPKVVETSPPLTPDGLPKKRKSRTPKGDNKVGKKEVEEGKKEEFEGKSNGVDHKKEEVKEVAVVEEKVENTQSKIDVEEEKKESLEKTDDGKQMAALPEEKINVVGDFISSLPEQSVEKVDEPLYINTPTEEVQKEEVGEIVNNQNNGDVVNGKNGVTGEREEGEADCYAKPNQPPTKADSIATSLEVCVAADDYPNSVGESSTVTSVLTVPKESVCTTNTAPTTEDGAQEESNVAN